MSAANVPTPMMRMMKKDVMRSASYILALVLFANPGWSADPAPTEPSAAQEAATNPALEAAIKKLNLPGVAINVKERCVDVDASVCLTRGMLELIACTKRTKEHESIVIVLAKAVHIHTALLLLGAQPGSPAMRKAPEGEIGRWIDILPRGGAVDVLLVLTDKEGKLTEHPISDFISRPSAKSGDAGNGKDIKFPTHTFIFAGSQLVGDGPGPRQYLSDLSGDVISISTFGDELLCLPDINSQDNDSLEWEVNAKGLPAVGTKVTLRLRPHLTAAAISSTGGAAK